MAGLTGRFSTVVKAKFTGSGLQLFLVRPKSFAAEEAGGGAGNGKAETAEERLQQKSTPLVRTSSSAARFAPFHHRLSAFICESETCRMRSAHRGNPMDRQDSESSLRRPPPQTPRA
mgnify:CR=1 FL=1